MSWSVDDDDGRWIFTDVRWLAESCVSWDVDVLWDTDADVWIFARAWWLNQSSVLRYIMMAVFYIKCVVRE